MPSFNDLGLSQDQLNHLQHLNFQTPTAIQQQSLPVSLSGRDVIAQAQTGSGKTLAFSLPMLALLKPKYFAVQGLILCPTRELAAQVCQQIRKLAAYRQNIKVVLLCGGEPIGPQFGSLEKGAHIIVGTPGRVADHLRKDSLDLSKVQMTILDEADRMLDMGFYEQVSDILQHTPNHRQTLLFSATFADDIEQLSQQFLSDPVHIVAEESERPSQIDLQFYGIGQLSRVQALFELYAYFLPSQVMIFCNTKIMCQQVVDFLQQQGVIAQALHGDREQRERDVTLLQFANGSCDVLVATDVAARGLDIADMPMVINADLPRQVEIFVHRIGRTGRSGQSGLALSLFADKEKYKLEAYQQVVKQSIETMVLPRQSAEFVPPLPTFQTLQIGAGKKQKIRAGDIVGTLTQQCDIAAGDIGDINLTPNSAFVAIKRNQASQAVGRLSRSKIKNRSVKVRLLD